MDFLADDREESIQLLQYYYFLKDLHNDLLKNADMDNPLIQDFLAVIQKDFLSYSTQIADYKTMLSDYIFISKGKIYLEILQKFVLEELSGTEFVDIILPQFYESLTDSLYLQMDFKRQVTLQLRPEIFRFSVIIGDYLFIMVKAFDQGKITEVNLREVIKEDILPKVKKYF